MDKRFRDRRRSLNRQRGRRRAGLLFVVILVLVAAGGFLWLRSSDVFAVRTIAVTATQNVTTEQVSNVTAEAIGVNLLRLSSGAIEEDLLALPYVRSAEVHRSFPNTLEIRLVEYEPVARLQDENGSIWLVAEDGTALGKSRPPQGAGLPLLVPEVAVSPVAGEQVPRVIMEALPVATLLLSEDIDEGLPALEQVVVSAGGLVVKLKGGTELRLGEPTQLKQKLTVAVERIQSYLRDGRQVAYVDASVPDRVAVKAK